MTPVKTFLYGRGDYLASIQADAKHPALIRWTVQHLGNPGDRDTGVALTEEIAARCCTTVVLERIQAGVA